MKWMIASDIHGSAVYCGQMLEAYRREKADRLLLLGDLLYHGPRNDLPKGYAPKEVIRMLNEVKEELLCVRGNCEADVDQMVLEFPVMADYCVLQLEDTGVVFASHGHVHNPQCMPPLKNGDILLNGHTHVPACEKIADENGNEYMYLNPGSVSIPKEGSSHSYMVFLSKSIFLTSPTLACLCRKKRQRLFRRCLLSFRLENIFFLFISRLHIPSKLHTKNLFHPTLTGTVFDKHLKHRC